MQDHPFLIFILHLDLIKLLNCLGCTQIRDISAWGYRCMQSCLTSETIANRIRQLVISTISPLCMQESN